MSTITRRRAGVTLGVLVLTGALVSACAGETADDTEADGAPGGETQADEELHALLPEHIREAGSVAVGTEAYYPPYEFIDPEDGETVIGLDLDLLDAVTARLGIEYDLDNVAFDTLLPSLDSGRYDVVVAGITDTAERQANYDFVNYFAADQAIIVAAGNEEGIASMADLCGLTVSVLVDSTQQGLLEALGDDECAGDPVDVLTQQTDTEALTQVQTGRAAALLTQEAVGVYNAEQLGGGSVFEVANEESIAPIPLGYVFAKGDDELRDAFQAALQSLLDDGTYHDILAEWGLENAALDEITVNAGS